MKRSHLPLSAIRAFEAAARHESFAHAAEELSVSQPAVSKQIALLEDRLGIELFERTHRNVSLTWHGRRLAPRLTDSIDRMQLAIEDITSTSPYRGPFKIMVESDLATLWLMPRLQTFEQQLSGTSVSMLTRIDPVTLDEDVAECAILWGDGWWADYESEPLFTNSAFPICTPDLAAQLREEPETLYSTRLIHDRTTAWWKRAALELDMPDLDWAAGPTYNQTSLCLEAARRGDGVTIGDEVSSLSYLDQGLLSIPFKLSLPSPVSYYFLSRRHSSFDREIALLREWLVQQAKEHRQRITSYWRTLYA